MLLALTQKGLTRAEVLALSEPEAASLIEILTEKPPGKTQPESAEHYVPRRKPKAK